MIRSSITAALVAAAALILPGVVRAQQASLAGLPFITVEGHASADVVPDTATLSVGVEAERPSASAATMDVSKAAQAVVDQIKAEGIEDKDVTTGSIALFPVDPGDSVAGAGQRRVSRSFRASTDLILTVRPPDRAGLVAAHLIDRGANTIEGIAFSSSTQAKTLDDLRAEAMRDAERKARLYVNALNLRLGRVLEITPQGDGGPPGPVFAQARTTILAAPTAKIPVQPGALTLRASVSVRWELLQ